MHRPIRAARAALVVAGAIGLFGAVSRAQAQRSLPRIGVAAPPARPAGPIGIARFDPRANGEVDPRRPGQNPFGQNPGWNGMNDPRRHDPRNDDRERGRRHSGAPTIIYVPVPADYGYGYGYAPGAYYPPYRSYGGVYDVNGRPLSASLEPEAPPEGLSYTPDLSGSAYTVSNEGMMVVDFQSGQRRAFPSCAGQTAAVDPQGRPRTVFYQPTDYWMVLRPGQRGRVQGTPPAGATACYAVDAVGKVVLRY